MWTHQQSRLLTIWTFFFDSVTFADVKAEMFKLLEHN